MTWTCVWVSWIVCKRNRWKADLHQGAQAASVVHHHIGCIFLRLVTSRNHHSAHLWITSCFPLSSTLATRPYRGRPTSSCSPSSTSYGGSAKRTNKQTAQNFSTADRQEHNILLMIVIIAGKHFCKTHAARTAIIKYLVVWSFSLIKSCHVPLVLLIVSVFCLQAVFLIENYLPSK